MKIAKAIMLFLGLNITTLNVSNFIARKIQKAHNSKGSIIRPVIKAAQLAIILGMILMLVSLATGLGLKNAIQQKIIGFSGHVVLTSYSLNTSYENAPLTLTPETKAYLATNPNIAHMQAIGTKAGILKGEEDFEGVVLKGIDSSYKHQFFSDHLRSGSWPKFTGTQRNDSVVISASLANRLHLAVHDAVRMYFIQEAPRPPRIRKFYVAGVYSTGLQEFDQSYIIGDLYHIRKLNQWQNGEVGGYEILLNNAEKLDETAAEIRANVPYNVDAKSIKETNAQLFQWLKLFDLNIYLILTIMIVVAIINMISALLILILDRTNMIGLLKALGANNRSIARIFLIQSAHIIIKGLVLGNIIGLAFCLAQHYFGFIKLDPETYYVDVAPISLNWFYILGLNVGVVVICMLALLLPAFMVSKISPVKALRYS